MNQQNKVYGEDYLKHQMVLIQKHLHKEQRDFCSYLDGETVKEWAHQNGLSRQLNIPRQGFDIVGFAMLRNLYKVLEKVETAEGKNITDVEITAEMLVKAFGCSGLNFLQPECSQEIMRGGK